MNWRSAQTAAALLVLGVAPVALASPSSVAEERARRELVELGAELDEHQLDRIYSEGFKGYEVFEGRAPNTLSPALLLEEAVQEHYRKFGDVDEIDLYLEYLKYLERTGGEQPLDLDRLVGGNDGTGPMPGAPHPDDPNAMIGGSDGTAPTPSSTAPDGNPLGSPETSPGVRCSNAPTWTTE